MGMVIYISPVVNKYISNQMNHIVDILMSVDFISHQFMGYTQYAMVS